MDVFKEEKKFVERLKKFPDRFLIAGENSVMEGFEYFKTPEYKNKPGAVQSRLKTLIAYQDIWNLLRLAATFVRIMPSMVRNINKNFEDMEEYLSAVESGGSIPTTNKDLINSYPNKRLWEELKDYAWKKHRAIVGFTELPQEYVFAGKAVPFRYALIFAQEMKREAIEKAPKVDAGIEVIKVYNSLGIATNDIANWLRKSGVICMANHPLGGLTDLVPLAEKAGLGAIGRHGLLITKEFGPRCRLSPIFLEQKLFEFTDSNSKEYSWISKFCSNCGNCIKSCPTNAIYSERKLSIKYNKENLKDRFECYDREKCFAYFSATMGCGVCIKVCPFSKNPRIYDRLKTKYEVGVENA
ncbi:MAG: hypothetical protein PWP09_1319 [Thermotogota bacterium]|nr:hypothetical protein [Thermotogota bacterium]